MSDQPPHENWLPYPVQDAAAKALAKLREQTPSALPIDWHLLVVEQTDEPTYYQFEHLSELVSKLQELVDTKPHCRVYIFLGARMSVTKPPRRLLTPFGPIRLFDTGETTDIDDDGYIGPEAPTPEGDEGEDTAPAEDADETSDDADETA